METRDWQRVLLLEVGEGGKRDGKGIVDVGEEGILRVGLKMKVGKTPTSFLRNGKLSAFELCLTSFSTSLQFKSVFDNLAVKS